MLCTLYSNQTKKYIQARVSKIHFLQLSVLRLSSGRGRPAIFIDGGDSYDPTALDHDYDEDGADDGADDVDSDDDYDTFHLYWWR